MLLNISREELLKCIQNVIGVVERRQTMPVLANILFKVNSDHLILTATDLEVQLSSQSNNDLKIEEEGETTIPGRKLFDICRNLPNGSNLRLSLDKERLVVRSGRSRFTLSTLPATEFPVLDEVNASQSVKLPQQKLKQQIELTQFAMAQQDVRYYLNGMLFEIKGGVLTTVATDGHRLALTSHPIDSSEDVQVIVPRKGVAELARLLDGEGDVSLSITQHHIQASFSNGQFISKLIDGKFPEYSRVIPSSTSHNIEVGRADLRSALQRAAILSNEKFRGIRLALSENTLGIHSHNPEQEEAEDALEISFAGDAFDIGFNVNYILDVLNVLPSDQINVGLNDANSSCLLSDNALEGAKFVIMPMRL